MNIISNTIDFQMDAPTAVVIGKFDGIHLGHKLLIDKLLKEKEHGLKTVVFTFDKSPASLFIQDGASYRELCTMEEKREIFRGFGIDELIEFPMNSDTARIPAEEFVTEILQKQLRCHKIIAGEDVSFGHKGRGDSHMLEVYGKAEGFEVEIVDKLLLENSTEEISSTWIRRAISQGNMGEAALLMGREYKITGEVIHGRGLAGSQLDMPTANQKWPLDKVIPAFGVYSVKVHVEDRLYRGITNVGQKPTVNQSEEQEILAETYLYDFDGDLYGKEMTIRFLEYIRPEQKFNSLQELKQQMKHDMEFVRNCSDRSAHLLR